MNAPRPLILDCDPGIDDFIAILMILAAPEHFNLLGITVTGGNVPLEYTTLNALKACELVGRRDVKVCAGCPAPLLRPLELEDVVHGENGLKGYDLPAPTMKPHPMHAVDFLIDSIMSSPERVTLATTAPLTNVALAIVREPRILDNISEIVTMGGSMQLGNITPAAEYNFYADPEAAYILYTADKTITSIGLDVSHHVLATSAWLDQIGNIGNEVGQAVSHLVRTIHKYDSDTFGIDGGALHDPCVIGYLLEPSLFKGKDVHVEIDTSFGPTRGRSIIDWWHKRGISPNAHVFNEVNAPGFFELLTNLLSRYTEPRQPLSEKGLS